MLEVREQKHLSFQRLLDVCLDSIRFRLTRSAVTVVIITLAIAFLTTVTVRGYLGRAVRDTVIAENQRLTAYSRFLKRAGVLPAPEEQVREISRAVPGSTFFQTVRAWGGLNQARAERFVENSRQVCLFLDFFNGIPLGRRVLLVEQHQGLEIFDWLQQGKNRQSFQHRLAQMKSLRLPGKGDAFSRFLQQWPAYRKQLETLRRENTKVLLRIRKFTAPNGLAAALAQALRQNRIDAFFKQIADLGLRIDAAAIPTIVQGVKMQADLDWSFGWLRHHAVRGKWNQRFQENFSPGLALQSCAAAPARIQWIQSMLAKNNAAAGFDPARFLAVAQQYTRAQRLQKAEQKLVSRYGRSRQLGGRTLWLMCVSFLVCVVGIANAMLMTVLERFKEIATMKCLGARNETIAFMFVTESIIMGLVGGLLGLVLGFLVEFSLQLIAYQGLVLTHFPTMNMLKSAAICLGCSLALAMSAAIYPARVAARMAPMDAMRVD